MNVLNADNNKNGGKIKIILGSPAASEGLSFLRVREIHILDPWHNFNRIEQAIGRGIRRCSHKDLLLEERNVTVYYYASIIDDSMESDSSEEILDMETVDLKTYRIAVNKVSKISEVEHMIKKNAIDCNLMKENNLIKEDRRFTDRPITTSKNKDVKEDFFDKDYSRNCNYQVCDYECNPPENELNDANINKDTYDIIYARTDIDKTKKIIKRMYNQKFIYTMKDIIKFVKKDILNIDDIFIYKAVRELMEGNDRYALIDKYNREGHIIHRGRYYIFQPFILDDNTLPLYYRRTPLTIKKDNFGINTLARNTKTQPQTKNKVSTKDIKETIMIQKGVLRNMVFERLLFDEMKALYNDLVLERDVDDDFQQFLIDNYSYNLIKNHHIGIKGGAKDTIIGYRLGNKNKKIVSYCLEGEDVIECGRFQLGRLKTTIKKPLGTRANIIAFMDKTKILRELKTTITIKKFDETTQDKLELKKTDSLMKFSDEIGSLGYICIHSAGRGTKFDLISHFKKLGGVDEEISRASKRIYICHSLEEQLRINDQDGKAGKRWFYTFEEAISLGYFSKKKK